MSADKFNDTETEEEFLIGSVSVAFERSWLCVHCGRRLVRRLGGQTTHMHGQIRCFDKDGELLVPHTDAEPTDWF